MNKLIKSHHPRRQVKSFKYAFHGIFHALLNEPNFRTHIFAAIIVTLLGFYFRVTPAEWSVLVLTMGFVLVAEMLNTVVEEVIDYIIQEEHEVARVVKDLASGFVLVTAIVATIIFIIIFGHRLPELVA